MLLKPDHKERVSRIEYWWVGKRQNVFQGTMNQSLTWFLFHESLSEEQWTTKRENKTLKKMLQFIYSLYSFEYLFKFLTSLDQHKDMYPNKSENITPFGNTLKHYIS